MTAAAFPTRIVGTRGVYHTDLHRSFQQGAQGELFHARSSAGDRLAIKLYHPGKASSAIVMGIGSLADEASPGDAFLWPLDVVDHDGRFGYVMRLAPSGYVPLRAVMAGEVTLGFATAIDVALQIVEGFRRLHKNGYHYCDISDGNVLLDPQRGHVLICDNDNVGHSDQPPTIQGTPSFMAPEVGRRAVPPSASSDKFSLGVLLFLLLVGEHPLEGRRDFECPHKTPRDLDVMYCNDPLFIFDPDDDANRPVAGWQDNAIVRWPLLPAEMRATFVRLFTSGLHAPARRPGFVDWNAALVDARDRLVHCGRPGCGAQQFLDVDDLDQRCWACAAEIGEAGLLVVDTGRSVRFTVVIDATTEIRDYHLTGRLEVVDIAAPAVGAVAEHPDRPGVWGIRNLTSTPWQASFPTGERLEIHPGRAVALRDGTVIDFGPATGTVTFPAAPA